MYEIGPGIIPYAAGLHLHTDIAQPSGIIVRNPDIGGLPLHMKTILCNSPGFSPKHGVCFRRTVSGNDMKLNVMTDGLGNGMEKIDKIFVDRFNFSRIMIPKNIIDFSQGTGQIPPLGVIANLKSLMGMGIIEGEPAFRYQKPVD